MGSSAHRLRQLVKYLGFALVVHFFVIPQIGGARNALTVVSSVNPILLGVAVVLEAGSLLAYSRTTHQLLSEGHRPSMRLTFGAVLASTAVSHVVPGGAATSAAVSYRLLGRSGADSDDLSFALGAQAIGSAVVLNVLLWVALIASIPVSGYHPIYATAAAVGAVLMTGFAALVTSLLRGRHALAARVARWVDHVPGLSGDNVRAAVIAAADQLRLLIDDRKRRRTVIVMAALNWLLDAAALWIVLVAFGSAANVIGLMVAYGLANVMAAIPISPGGLGVVEAILIPTLIGFGTPVAVASVGVVAFRLVEFWLPIPIGAGAYYLVGRATSGTDRPSFVDEVNRQTRRE